MPRDVSNEKLNAKTSSGRASEAHHFYAFGRDRVTTSGLDARPKMLNKLSMHGCVYTGSVDARKIHLLRASPEPFNALGNFHPRSGDPAALAPRNTGRHAGDVAWHGKLTPRYVTFVCSD